MKIKNLALIKASCDKIKNIKMPIKTAYKLSKLQKAIEEELSFSQGEYKKIVDEYAERDETGNYKFLDEAKTNIQIKSNCFKEAEQKMNELQNLEIELPKITFALSEFENIELSPEDISGIIDFIEEEAE